MRHRNRGRTLGRTGSHRHLMFRNMMASLIKHKRIKTTVPKGKELQRMISSLLTLAKTDTLANRRLAFSRLRDGQAVLDLFSVIGPAIASRPGGYTRLLRCGFRSSDKAPMALVQLVDFPVSVSASSDLLDEVKTESEFVTDQNS